MAWIPESFAKVGKFLRVGDSDGWQVIHAHSRQSEEYLMRHERDYLTERRASDI